MYRINGNNKDFLNLNEREERHDPSFVVANDLNNLGENISSIVDNGVQITSNVGTSASKDMTYIGNGEIVYRAADTYLYYKSVYDTSNGTPLVVGDSPVYIGNGEIIYRNPSTFFLYRKSAYDTSTGTQITSQVSSQVIYIGNGEIVYTGPSSTYYLYRKSAYDTSNGTQITSGIGFKSTYIGNGEIVYVPSSTTGTLVRKSVYDTSNGTSLSVTAGNVIVYVGNGEIIYSRSSDSVCYRKSAYNTDAGVQATGGGTIAAVLIGKEIVYITNTNPALWRTSVYKVGGTILTATNQLSGADLLYVGNGEIVYKGAATNYYLYRKRIW